MNDEGVIFSKSDLLYKADLIFIQSALREKGISKTLNECSDLWDKYSSDLHASWLDVPNDSQSIYDVLEPYL